MEKDVIRCINNYQLRDIKDDIYVFDKVCVYYGFHNHNRTAKQILELIDIIKAEVPGVGMSDLNVYEISRFQSNLHAGHTMVSVYVDVNVVRNNIDNYIIL